MIYDDMTNEYINCFNIHISIELPIISRRMVLSRRMVITRRMVGFMSVGQIMWGDHVDMSERYAGVI